MHFLQFIYLLIIIKYTKTDDFEATLGQVKSEVSKDIQKSSVDELIHRLIPDRSVDFKIEIEPSLAISYKDVFKIVKNESGPVIVSASSGVAAAWGFHHYLKYYCLAHISFDSQQLNLPKDLPVVNITITANDRFRYYMNLCAYGYSHVWWTWTDWEKHIDWIAMNGYNLVPAFIGIEEIWSRVYKKLGMTDKEIEDHFTGPAFLPWNRQGNIRKWGGPLSKHWHARSIVLQKAILRRMRNLGITPILSSFTGYVPTSFSRLYPNTTFMKSGSWSKFKGKYCCMNMIDVSDPLFKTVGGMFMEEQIVEFGTNHIYINDVFNEINPKSNDTKYLQTVSQTIYSAMEAVDTKAVWVLQSWPFLFSKKFWTNKLIEAFLTGVPLGKMLILDLFSDQFAHAQRLKSYFGQPFIWCVLHNFGGTIDMYGPAHKINSLSFPARSFVNSTMVGTGLAPEGIEANYILYDLTSELGWRKEPTNLPLWFHNYTVRRYGKENINASKSWDILRQTLYQYTMNSVYKTRYIVCDSPYLAWRPFHWYNNTQFMWAWDYMIQAADDLGNNTGFRHDLVDVTKQAIQDLLDTYYKDLVIALRKKQVAIFKEFADMFKELFDDLDELLATNKDFLLGTWLESAKAIASTPLERRINEYNARTLITLWGPRGEIKDYACKNWAGLVKDYHGARWKLYLDEAYNSLVKGKTFISEDIQVKVFYEIEKPFTRDTKLYPTQPKGDTIKVAKRIYKKWRSKAKEPVPSIQFGIPHNVEGWIEVFKKFSHKFIG